MIEAITLPREGRHTVNLPRQDCALSTCWLRGHLTLIADFDEDAETTERVFETVRHTRVPDQMPPKLIGLLAEAHDPSVAYTVHEVEPDPEACDIDTQPLGDDNPSLLAARTNSEADTIARDQLFERDIRPGAVLKVGADQTLLTVERCWVVASNGLTRVRLQNITGQQHDVYVKDLTWCPYTRLVTPHPISVGDSVRVEIKLKADNMPSDHAEEAVQRGGIATVMMISDQGFAIVQWNEIYRHLAYAYVHVSDLRRL